MLDPENDNEQVGNKYPEEPDDDVTLASLVHRSRSSSKIKAPRMHSFLLRTLMNYVMWLKTLGRSLSRSCTNHSTCTCDLIRR
jgi:hypothetical protein